MIDPSEGKEIKRDYLEILEALLKQIKQKGDEQGIKTNDEITIFVGSKKAYEVVLQQKPRTNKITPEQVSAIAKAIFDPQNSKGSVSIRIGQEKLFHVKDGEVLADKLNLTNSVDQSKKAIESERTYSVESLQQQVEVLQQKVQEQQKLVDSFASVPQTEETLVKLSAQVQDLFSSVEKQQKLIEKTQQGLSLINEHQSPTVTNSKLQNWVGAVESKVKDTSEKLFKKVKSALTPEIVKLRKEVEKQVESLKTQVTQEVASIKNEMLKKADDMMLKVDTKINSTVYDLNTKIEDVRSEVTKTVKDGIKTIDAKVRATKGKAIESAVSAMLHLFGDRNQDGSVTFESENFDFQQVGNAVTIKAKDGRDILKDGVISAIASEKEVQILEQVQPDIDEYLRHTESQSQSRGIKR